MSSSFSTTPVPPPTRICLFSGATSGVSPAHMAAARALAHTMHTHGIQLVYGGGIGGLMGEVAKTLVQLSGKDAVMGVTPSSLISQERPGTEEEVKKAPTTDKVPINWLRRMGLGGEGSSKAEKAKLLLDDKFGHVTIVPDIHARILLMMELVRDGGPGSGFVALSGGIGTIDEIWEVISYKKFGAHNRGVCVLNVEGFWDGLLEWIRKAAQEKFIKEDQKQILGSVTEVAEVVGWLKGYDEGRASESENQPRDGGENPLLISS